MPSLLRSLWAVYRTRQQSAAFNRLLAGFSREHIRPTQPPKSLSELRKQRRLLSPRPKIAALGHEVWEQYGLWPSFKKISDFQLYPADLKNGSWSSGDRQHLSEDFLSFIDKSDQVRPVELVFIYCDSSFIAPDLLKELSARGIWTVLMGLDDKHKFAQRKEFGMRVGQSAVAPYADVYWTVWKAGLPLFEKIGAKPVYLAEGADPVFHKPLNISRDIDVLFLGQRYGRRKRFVSHLCRQGFDIKAYGKGWPEGFVSFEKSVELINRAKVVLGTGDVGYLNSIQHLKGRDFEVPMCGAVYLTSFNPELADWFDVGKEILCYSSVQNCAEVLRWVLGNPNVQENIRTAALTRSLRDHTWERRISTIFDLIRQPQ